LPPHLWRRESFINTQNAIETGATRPYRRHHAIPGHELLARLGVYEAHGLTDALSLDERPTVTATFLTLAFAQLWHVFNMHSIRARVFVKGVTKNT